ncbi:MAG: tRNA (guanosine(37)-N1)-methyltransferase TrmD [Alphaproteobacteria bacterium]|nr:tRNA (guanosine(37)-N1)-methyltransferase TrmD [Alphaproteobacteria bacterium]
MQQTSDHSRTVPDVAESSARTSDAPWTAWVLTLFPTMFPGPVGESLAGTALENGIWNLETVDIRGFASDKHRSVDDTPFGGGPGMVLRADTLAKSVDEAAAAAGPEVPIIYLSPRGRPFDQSMARTLAQGAGVVLICGRFEGIDERLLEARPIEEVSLGDFVLSGGEPAAIAVIDSVVRLLPDVIGDPQSACDDSFERGLLEYPQYTRPQEWEGRSVPEVLLSGHHERISQWRREQAERTTRTRRPDLWKRYMRARDELR